MKGLTHCHICTIVKGRRDTDLAGVCSSYALSTKTKVSSPSTATLQSFHLPHSPLLVPSSKFQSTHPSTLYISPALQLYARQQKALSNVRGSESLPGGVKKTLKPTKAVAG